MMEGTVLSYLFSKNVRNFSLRVEWQHLLVHYCRKVGGSLERDRDSSSDTGNEARYVKNMHESWIFGKFIVTNGGGQRKRLEGLQGRGAE